MAMGQFLAQPLGTVITDRWVGYLGLGKQKNTRMEKLHARSLEINVYDCSIQVKF